MPNALVRLKNRLQEQGGDPSLLAELERDYAELVHKADRLETLLITIVRTGWPWDEEGGRTRSTGPPGTALRRPWSRRRNCSVWG